MSIKTVREEDPFHFSFCSSLWAIWVYLNGEKRNSYCEFKNITYG
jgi:hypothetical protein